MSTTTAGATIRYTTNGADPTSTSTAYSGPFSVSATTTVRARTFANGMNSSAVASASYTIAAATAATPSITPASGTYNAPVSVSMSTTTVGAVIRYTTNGADPTEASTAYTGPINVSATTTVRARAYAAGMNPSAVASASYTISVSPAAAWYVAPGGSDSSAGNSAAVPFATIQRALDVAKSGETILVAPGTYSGLGNSQIDFKGKAVRLISQAGPLQTIIDCGQRKIALLNNNEGPSTLISGFTFRNAYFNQTGDWGWAVLFEMSNSSPTIENCVFRDNRVEGTFYTGTSSATIMSSGSGRPTLRNCLFYNNVVRSGDNAAGADIIRGNYQLVENCTIANNTIDAFMINWWYFIHKSALRVVGMDSTSTVRNCVMWGNTISIIGARSERQPRTSPLTTPTASYSIFQDGLAGIGMLNQNPLFRNPVGGDFALLPGSPAINSGDPNSPRDTDGSRADMGCR